MPRECIRACLTGARIRLRTTERGIGNVRSASPCPSFLFLGDRFSRVSGSTFPGSEMPAVSE